MSNTTLKQLIKLITEAELALEKTSKEADEDTVNEFSGAGSIVGCSLPHSRQENKPRKKK